MSWADEKIAHPMGYEYAVLFPRARDAIAAYVQVTGKKLTLPSNICPLLKPYCDGFEEVDGETGLAYLPVHLYGYRAEHGPADLTLDPLMTGWGRKPLTPSCIVSFGRKKWATLNYGGAFLTSDQNLAESMESRGWFPFKEDEHASWFIQTYLVNFWQLVYTGFDKIDKWDAALGNLFLRIRAEQIIPWRVMRRTYNSSEIICKLRERGIPVGTGYPTLIPSIQGNKWELQSLCFFPDSDPQMMREAWLKK